MVGLYYYIALQVRIAQVLYQIQDFSESAPLAERQTISIDLDLSHHGPPDDDLDAPLCRSWPSFD